MNSIQAKYRWLFFSLALLLLEFLIKTEKFQKRNSKLFVKQRPLFVAVSTIFFGINIVGALGKARIYLQPEDVFENRKQLNMEFYDQLRSKYDHYDKVVLWLSRTELDPGNLGYKAPERFEKAINQYLRENLDANIKIIFGMHGSSCKELAERMLARPWGDKLDFVEHLPQHELMSYLALPNAIVMDDFEYALSTSGMVREGLSVSAVMIRRLHNEELDFGYGPNCPIYDATNVDEIFGHLKHLIEMNFTDFQKEREKVSEWAERYLHWESSIHKVEDILWNAVMVNKNLERDNSLVKQHSQLNVRRVNLLD